VRKPGEGFLVEIFMKLNWMKKVVYVFAGFALVGKVQSASKSLTKCLK
jgi:hypothetical protein